MKKQYDVIVAGRGIAGLTAALALAKRGKRVLVVGKKSKKGEATPASAGILDPFLEMKPHSLLFKLSCAAYRFYPGFIAKLKKETGLDPGYEACGMLYVAFTPAEEHELRRRYAWQKRAGIKMRILNAKEVLQREPALNPKLRMGLLYEDLPRVQPRRLMKAIVKCARQHGVEFKNGEGLPINSSAPVLINATGAWAAQAHGMRLPVSPVRGQILLARSSVKMRAILHSLDGGYIVPWGKNRYLLGSTVEHAGFKPRVTRAGVASIKKKIMRIVPGLAKMKVVDSWAGLRPYSKINRPLIGRTNKKGVYVAAGYYRSGILISPYVAEGLADLIESDWKSHVGTK